MLKYHVRPELAATMSPRQLHNPGTALSLRADHSPRREARERAGEPLGRCKALRFWLRAHTRAARRGAHRLRGHALVPCARTARRRPVRPVRSLLHNTPMRLPPPTPEYL